MRPFHWALLMYCLAAAPTRGDEPATQPAGRALVATPITLHIKDEPPAFAFAKFSKAVGFDIQPSSNTWDQNAAGSVTLDADNAPYWKVMEELCAATGVFPGRFDNGKLVLMRDTMGWASRPTAISGPFRIDIAELSAARQITLGRQPVRSVRENLSFGVSAEPGIKANLCEIALDSAQDQDGRPINRAGAIVPIISPFIGNQASMSLGIDHPATSTKIARMQVQLSMTTTAASEAIQVESFLNSQIKREIAGIEFTFSAKSLPVGYEVSILLFNVRADPELWKRIRPVLTGIRPVLVDDKGAAYQLGGSGNGLLGASRFHFSYNFSLPPRPAFQSLGRPAKLMWEIPTKLVATQFPATFENLPLHQ